jgi:DNA-binding transcriptional MerR regulator
MQIGELSKKSGFSRDTIRFYEKLGLIKMQDTCRNKFQHKDYPEGVLRRLMAIRTIKDYGFTLQETLGMLMLFEEGVLEERRARKYVEKKIRRVEEKIDALMAVKSRLEEILHAETDEDCPIGRVLKEMC